MALNVLIYSESEGDTMKEIYGRRRSGIISSSKESIITNKTAYIGENEDKKWLNETFMNIDDQMDPEDFEFTETTYEELVKKMNVFYWQRAQYVVCCIFLCHFLQWVHFKNVLIQWVQRGREQEDWTFTTEMGQRKGV